MAEFTWSATPRWGTCVACGTSANDGGFIDTFATVDVKNDMGAYQGNIDVIICASCVTQMARLVGNASKQEVEELIYQINEKDVENEKLRDEVQAWSERFNALANATASDLAAYADWKKAQEVKLAAPKSGSRK